MGRVMGAGRITGYTCTGPRSVRRAGLHLRWFQEPQQPGSWAFTLLPSPLCLAYSLLCTILFSLPDIFLVYFASLPHSFCVYLVSAGAPMVAPPAFL